jgi:hypothetical protein
MISLVPSHNICFFVVILNLNDRDHDSQLLNERVIYRANPKVIFVCGVGRVDNRNTLCLIRNLSLEHCKCQNAPQSHVKGNISGGRVNHPSPFKP